jgi:hypothetical protein
MAIREDICPCRREDKLMRAKDIVFGKIIFKDFKEAWIFFIPEKINDQGCWGWQWYLPKTSGDENKVIWQRQLVHIKPSEILKIGAHISQYKFPNEAEKRFLLTMMFEGDLE